MPQPMRPDEQAASSLVSKLTGVTFEFSGGTGGIDFTSLDHGMRTVLEVTRCTRPSRKKDELAAAAHAGEILPLWTCHSWWVTFDGHPRYTGMAERLSGPLRQLETHGLSEFDRTMHSWWMRISPTLTATVQDLHNNRVLAARILHTREPSEPSQLFISASEGFAYGGPDGALQVLEAFLHTEAKHLNKTVNEPADVRHLFVWTDMTTDEALSRALRSTWPAVPTRGHNLHPALDHLWLVDDPTGRGWHYGPHGWEPVEVGTGP